MDASRDELREQIHPVPVERHMPKYPERTCSDVPFPARDENNTDALAFTSEALSSRVDARSV